MPELVKTCHDTLAVLSGSCLAWWDAPMPIYALGDVQPIIDAHAFVHPDAVIIGDVRIGPGASIWPCAVLRGDSASITIGADSSVQDGVVIHTHTDGPTTVGARVTIGHCAHLEGCEVGDDALIGVNSAVLPGARVGESAVVGAGAVVTAGMHVPPRAMALGVPAKIKVDAVAEGMFAANVQAYRDHGARYRAELRRLPDHRYDELTR